MKKWVMAVAMGGLIVSFQNCSPSQLGETGSLDASSQQNPVTGARISDLVPSKAVAIEIPNSPIVDSGVGAAYSKAINSFNSYSLILNPQTGVINALRGNGEVDSAIEFCLNSQQIAELEYLLENARLYNDLDKSQEPDQICTMDYRYPYAKLYFDDQKVSLGEKFSGCHIGADLEKTSSLKLKSFLGDLLTNLAGSKCSFEEVK